MVGHDRRHHHVPEIESVIGNGHRDYASGIGDAMAIPISSMIGTERDQYEQNHGTCRDNPLTFPTKYARLQFSSHSTP